mgnify:CR=1 FL=1
MLATVITDEQKTTLSKITPTEKKQLQKSGQAVNDIWESTQQVIQYTDKNRNNFLFKFACNCNRVGITEFECEGFAQQTRHYSKTQLTNARCNLT